MDHIRQLMQATLCKLLTVRLALQSRGGLARVLYTITAI